MTRTSSSRFGANPEVRLRLLLGGAWRQVRIRHPSANTFLRGPFYREKARIRHSLPNKFLRGPFYLARKCGGALNVTSRPSYPAVHPACCLATSRTRSPSMYVPLQDLTPGRTIALAYYGGVTNVAIRLPYTCLATSKNLVAINPCIPSRPVFGRLIRQK